MRLPIFTNLEKMTKEEQIYFRFYLMSIYDDGELPRKIRHSKKIKKKMKPYVSFSDHQIHQYNGPEPIAQAGFSVTVSYYIYDFYNIVYRMAQKILDNCIDCKFSSLISTIRETQEQWCSDAEVTKEFHFMSHRVLSDGTFDRVQCRKLKTQKLVLNLFNKTNPRRIPICIRRKELDRWGHYDIDKFDLDKFLNSSSVKKLMKL